MDEVDFYYYIEGYLPGSSQRHMEAHLLRCEDCLEKLDAMLHNLADDLREPEGPIPSAFDYDVKDLLSRILPKVNKYQIH